MADSTPAAATATPPIPSISDIHEAFNALPKLASDGRNYLLWLERARVAVESLEAEHLFTAAPSTNDAVLSKRVKNAMFGKMDDGVFMLTKRQADLFELITFLNSRFDAKTETIKAGARRKKKKLIGRTISKD